jgi:hypothetical protein
MSFIGEIADLAVSIAESIGEFLWDVRALFVLWFLYMMFCCAFFPPRYCPGCQECEKKCECTVWPRAGADNDLKKNDNYGFTKVKFYCQ